MKKLVGILFVTVLSITTFTATAQQTWEAKQNATVDSITSQYKEKYIAPKAELTIADIFPAIGNYESGTNTDAALVTISIDPDNKGLVWIEGLPQGKIKAMLRKSPATYKIPAQKTVEGKDISEGTLIFDKETNTLSICIGKEYNYADPSTAFVSTTDNDTNATTKKSNSKKTTVTKAWIYTGTKIEKETVMN